MNAQKHKKSIQLPAIFTMDQLYYVYCYSRGDSAQIVEKKIIFDFDNRQSDGGGNTLLYLKTLFRRARTIGVFNSLSNYIATQNKNLNSIENSANSSRLFRFSPPVDNRCLCMHVTAEFSGCAESHMARGKWENELPISEREKQNDRDGGCVGNVPKLRL